ncbi:reverse transcriptase domain-containing protein [Tanacetum coccineum]
MHQLDTFYNALTSTDQDSLNAAAGGNLLTKNPRDALTIIENKSKVLNSQNKPIVSKVSTNAPSSSTPHSPKIAALVDVVKAILHQKSSPPASVKAVEEICVTCGGPQGINQGNPSYQAPIQQTQVAPSNELSNYKKINDANMKAMQNQINNVKNELRNEMQTTIQTSMSNQTNELKNMMASLFQINTASSSGLRSLPSNTVANPRGDLKAITTRSGISYDGPPIPPLPKVVEREPEVTKDTVQPSTKNIQPPVVHMSSSDDEPDSFHFLPRPTCRIVDYVVDPWVPLILGRPFLRTKCSLIDVYGEELTLRVDDEAITFKVGQTSRYSYNDAVSINRIDVIDSLDPILSTSSPSLIPFEEGDFILEEIKACLTNDSIPSRIDDDNFDLEGDLLLLEMLLNDDPSSPLPPKELYVEELKIVKSSIDDHSELELKDLPSHLEYAFLEGTDKLPVIIAKNLKEDEKVRLLKVLKSHKRAIAWKISDIKGIDPQFCTYKILIENDSKPAIQHQRRVNLTIHEVIKKEALIARGCMMAIFHDMIKETMEVFMDDFSVFEDSFSSCLSHLDKMLKRCEDTNLVLNWEKCHFMVKEGIVLGHKISKSGIEVDKAKVDVIAKLPHPTFVKGIRSFLGHAGFYRRFIQDFSKIARPMTRLLEKETPFIFSKECIESFNILKKKLTEAPILVAPDWDLPFEIMCDASDYAVGAVLGKRKTKHCQPIHYASKTMTDAQAHYTTTEKELLAVVYAFEKFWPYLVLSKTIVYTDHSTLKYLLAKQDDKLRLLWWILLLQKFDDIICDKKGAENLAA